MEPSTNLMYSTGSNIQPETQQPRLLLVDDNPEQLRLLIEALRAKSYRISVAFDGFQGYDRAVSIIPDLIVLDVHMPRMDGFALCRRLKANAATAHIPILYLSSDSEVDKKLAGLTGGGVDYILKPYEPEEVVARVQIHLALVAKTSVSTTAHTTNQPATPMDEDSVLVRAVQQELKSNLSLTPRLADIATQLGVNERRISRAFRKCLDMTPFAYLRQERMKKACQLLTETTLTIVVISQEVGFLNAANFSTAFREDTGVSPSDYRRNSLTTQVERT